MTAASNILNLMQVGIPAEQATAMDVLYASAFTQSLVPGTASVYDVGSITKQIRGLYLTNVLDLSFEVVAGAGTIVTDAAALSVAKIVHQVTGANGTVGVKFAATSIVGTTHVILNTTAGVLKIYANTGGTVNGGSVDAAFSALTGIKPIIAICTGTDTWIAS